MRYQLFTLYRNNETERSYYLNLQSKHGTYTIFVHTDKFVALEDFILCIPNLNGKYFYHGKKYLVVVDKELTQLGFLVDDDE